MTGELYRIVTNQKTLKDNKEKSVITDIGYDLE